MQQTEKRNFNIIETPDPFLPEALNDNTRKIEAALDAHEDAVAARMDALDQRIQVFEAKKFAYGDFSIGDETLHIALGFAPKLVFIHRVYFPGTISYMLADSVSNQGWTMQLKEDGFDCRVYDGVNHWGGQYVYFAVG